MALKYIAILSLGGMASAADLKVIKYAETSGGYHSPARGWNSFGLQANDVGAGFTFDQGHVTTQCDLMAQKLKSSNYTYCSLDSGWSVGGNGDEYGDSHCYQYADDHENPD